MLDIQHCIALAWSPQGGIMQTFERPDREKGNQHKTLKVQSPILGVMWVIYRICDHIWLGRTADCAAAHH